MKIKNNVNISTQIRKQKTKKNSIVSFDAASVLKKEKLQINSDKSSTISIESLIETSEVLTDAGVSKNRPEIVASINFSPAFLEGELTPSGRLLGLQFLARSLVSDSIAYLLSLPLGTLKEEAIKQLKDNLAALQTKMQQKLIDYSIFVKNVDDVIDALDLKDNTEIKPEIQQLRAARGDVVIKNNQSVTQTTPPLGMHSSLRDILVCHLGFTSEGYSTFSNSKVIGQIIADLRSTLLQHSPLLFTSYDHVRVNDRDPLLLHNTPSKLSPFTFTMSDISSRNSNFSGANFENYQNFLESLPPDEISRFKLLTSVLSRELRISAGIAQLKGTALDAVYNFSEIGLINRLLGDLGTNSLGGALPNTTLGSIVRRQNVSRQYILTFERRIVYDPETVQFIPGATYYAKNILTSDVAPDVVNLESFSNDMKEVIENVMSCLKILLNYDDTLETLHNTHVTKIIFQSFKDCLVKLGGGQTQIAPDRIGALSFALLSFSQRDSVLKHYLFRYIKAVRDGLSFTESSTLSSEADDTTDFIPGSDRAPGDNNDAGFNLDRVPKDSDFSDSFDFIEPPQTTRVGANPKLSNTVVSKPIKNAETLVEEAALKPSDLPKQIANRITYLLQGSAALNNANNNQSSNLNIVDFSTTQIIDALNYSFAGVTSSIMNAIVDVCDAIYTHANSIASKSGDTTLTAFDVSSSSLHTGYSKDTFLMLVFELMCDLTSEFVAANFERQGSTSTLNINLDANQNYSVVAKLDEVLTGTSNYIVLPEFVTLTSLLASIHSTLLQEDSLTRDLTDSILAIKNVFTRTSDTVLNFFKFKNLQSQTVKRYREYFNSPTEKFIIKHLSNTQVALSWNVFLDNLTTVSDSLIASGEEFTMPQLHAIEALCKLPTFSLPKNIVLLAVGCPMDMTDSLRNPPYIVGTSTSLETPIVDIVTIKVYRRDPLNPDLVLEPKKFVFDISKFFDVTSLPTNNNASFADLLESVELRDIIGTKGVVNNTVNKSSFLQDASYSSLTDSDKLSMFTNHVIDGILKLYVRLQTGLNLSEYIFTSEEASAAYASIDEDVGRIIGTTDSANLKQFFNIKTASEDSSNINESQRILTSLMFNLTRGRASIELPKVFERIFLVPIVLDDYTPNIQPPDSTPDIIEASTKFDGKNTIEEVKDSLKQLNNTPCSLSELFVTVTLGVDA